MAKPDTLTAEESDLRRRARRRLVGAVALALLAVVVLPMVFNPEPKPLGTDVDIRIPDQATPFRPDMPTPAPDREAGKGAAEAVSPAPATVAPAAGAPSATGQAKPPEPAKAEPPSLKPDASSPERAAVQEKEKIEAKTAAKADAKSSAPASEGFAAKGYYLQLGAFTNEGNARQLADKARAAGFSPTVQSVAGQVRVRIGPYQERKEALEMQARLRAKGFGPVLLGP